VKAARALQAEGHDLIAIGDDGYRTVFKKFVDLNKKPAPDFLSVTKGNKLVISEVKGGDVPLLGDGGAITQLESGMKAAATSPYGGDVSQVRIIMQKGAKLKDNDFAVVEGFLVRLSEPGKRYEIVVDGMKKWVTVVQL
jgi:hypothetical protein